MRSTRSLNASIFLLVASSCGGFSGSPCHSTTQCLSGLYCIGPDEGPSCGIAPRHDCATNSDCTGGDTCNAISDPCSASGVGSECAPPCTTCDTGFRCNASGACEPTPCDEGTVCSAILHCDTTVAHDTSGAVYNHSSGCVQTNCSQDSDCAATQACVNGVCQQGIGSCGKEEAVP